MSDQKKPSRNGSSSRASSSRGGWRRDSFLQAGLIVGAALGAAVTVAGRRMERSARRGLIDWRAVERLAADRVRNSQGTLTRAELAAAEPIYAASMREIVPALGAALQCELPGIVERSGVVSREEWVRTNVTAFAQLMGKVEGDLLKEILPPDAGFVKSAMAVANRAVATRQLGFMLSFIGQRVLGQYDLSLLSAEATPGRLVFVDENIRRAASSLGVPLNPFRTWIALHETTHAFEFEAHPWLRPYLAGRLERQMKSLSGGVSALRPDAAVRLGRTLRGKNSGENWMEGLMTDQQRLEFREMQAVMSLLEGFGDYMMDEVGRDLVPEVELISQRFHARREQRGALERAIMRLPGLDLKMAQYKQGEEFVAEIARARGPEALQALWRGPESLPLPSEMSQPSLWLKRVLP